MSRSARAGPPGGASRLEHVLAVGLRVLSIGVGEENVPEAQGEDNFTPVAWNNPRGGGSRTPERKVEKRERDSSGQEPSKRATPKDAGEEEKLFRKMTSAADTPEKICSAVSAYLRGASRACKSQINLELKRGDDLKFDECAGGARRPFIHFTGKDYYLVLSHDAPGGACTLSTLGIKQEEPKQCAEPMFENAYLEIFTNTADSQACKGYNTILSAVAVMIAFVQNMVLYSFNVNEQNLSSYTLMRSYEFLQCSERTPRGPLSQEEACAASKRGTDDVGVTPTPENFRRAQEIILERAVACAEAAKRQGAPGIPPLHRGRADACAPCP